MTEEKGRVLYSADFSPKSAVCPKCQDRGFTEENHGLIVIACDCEKGKEYRAQREDVLGIPKEEVEDKPKVLILPHYEGDDRPFEERVEEAHRILEGANDNTGGTGQDDKPAGSANPREPKQPSKRKARKKAAKKPR